MDFWYTVFNNARDGWGDKDTFAMACKAAGQPYHQVHRQIVTVFVEGTSNGTAMVQADPTVTTGHSPMFMHANIIKLAVTELLCSQTCRATKWPKNRVFHLIDGKSPINAHLKESRRIFSPKPLFDIGVDPEPTLWTVLENLACRTQWGSSDMCRNARHHMEKTFGFNITRSDGEEDVCIAGPWAKPANAKPRPDNWK